MDELVEEPPESDIEKWASDESELLQRSAAGLENASYSTQAKLIAPGIIVPGTLSLTQTDLYFDANEDDPLYKKLDPKVCLTFVYIPKFLYKICSKKDKVKIR